MKHLSARNYQRILLIVLSLWIPGICFGQDSTGRGDTLNFRGEINVTNNGFSFIPAFALNRPAATLDIGLGWKRFSFEPQFRFSLDGEPWGFIFIYRYKMIARRKFQLLLGSHLPGMPFKRKTTTSPGGVTTDELVVNRYIVGELIPTYWITRQINVGMYYSYAHGAEKEAIQNGHFISMRAGFSNVVLSKHFRMNFAPQFFYMKLDERDGYYFSANLSISKTNFPISVGSATYNAFRSDVAGKAFDWNVSLIYAVSRKYASQ